MKRTSKTWIREAVRRAGLDVHRTSNELNCHQQRRLIFDNLGIDVVIDVGANIGQYAGTHLRQWSGYSGRIESLEPVRRCFQACAQAAIADGGWRVHGFGLSDVAGTVPISVPPQATDLSSMHALSSVGEKMLDQGGIVIERVEVRRLDDVVEDLCRPLDRVALKIDVQGHEGAVLRGATESLRKVIFIECEVPLVSLYKGESRMTDVLAILEHHGFVPVGLRSNRLDVETGFAMDADIMLVKESVI